ncbi:MAG TPA: TetR/AcrR family transcriptional regulator, partial [Candidatus Angelobacter sp.]
TPKSENQDTIKTNVRAIIFFRVKYFLMPVSTPRRSRDSVPKGVRTRENILQVAVNLASMESLEGLSIGRLADELKMSKSGLFAHFGSREELQLATVEMARQIFVERVIRPALAAPEGAPRLWALCDAWVRYVERPVFPGGCFFAAASFEFDSRPGMVRDRIAAAVKQWLATLTRAVEEAIKAGHLKANIDPNRFAFEIKSIGVGAHSDYQLTDDRKAMGKARSIVRDRIHAVATPSCPRLSTQPKKRSSRPS